MTVTSWLIPVMLGQRGWSDFGYLRPAIIFILCFVYFDHNGGSGSSASDKKPPSITEAGTLPLNMYQTVVHRGERKFAPVERVEQLEVSKEGGRAGAPTSKDSGGGG